MLRRRPNLRPKTIRRLLIVAAVVGLAGASVGVAYLMHRRSNDAQVALARQNGLTAFDQGNYAAALPELRTAVAARPDDVDVQFALAAAQISLDTQSRGALVEARSRLEQLLRLSPKHDRARHKLLDIYERIGVSREMLSLADEILTTAPTDVAALRGRALALSRLEQRTAALPAWKAYVAAAPDDVRGQLQLIAAMRQAGATPEAVVAHARQLADAHGTDPRYRMPLAEVLRDAGRDAEGLAILRSLAATPPTDETTLIELVAALDRARAFEEAERLLIRAADTLGSNAGSAVSTALVERLWRSGKTAQVIDLTDRLLAAGRRDASVLAVRALALSAVGRREDAKPLIAELAARRDEPTATAWTAALSTEFAATPLAPADRLKALRDATQRDPSNTIARLWLARALAAADESDAAAVQYREVAQRAPSWATPCIELADVMRAAGRSNDAIVAAKAALLRAPASGAAQVIAARVRFDSLDLNTDPAEPTALLTFVAALRQQLPTEPTLAPMHVTLLARTGQLAEAQALVQSLLTSTTSAALLSDLYAVDRRHSLGQADAIVAKAATAGLVTPELLYRRALDMLADGKSADAISLVQQQSAAHAGDVAWALLDARFRTRAGDPSAADAWGKLLAAHANDPRVLAATIDENAPLAGGRSAKAELIDRLHTLNGGDATDATPHRIRRAVFLADSPDPQDVRAALTLATELVRQQPGRSELRVLLARTLVKLDNTTTALEHLRAASELSPADVAVALELASLLRREGRLDEALPVLRRIASLDAGFDATRRIQVAAELLDVGLPDVAADMLGRAAKRQPLDVAGTLAYAESLRASGKLEAANVVFATISEASLTSPATLAAAARFARSGGRDAQASTLVARLSALPASADRDRALARFHAAFDEVDAARSAYAAAIAQATDASIACEAASFEMSRNAIANVDTVLRAAESRFAGDAGVRRLRTELTARQQAAASPQAMGDLIASLAADPSRKAEADALVALRDARIAGASTPALADAVTRLAGRNPANVDLASLAIEANLSVGRLEAAGMLANRLAADHATRADAQSIASRALLASGQRSAARRAAERWRAIEPTAARDADTLLATIALADRDAKRAATILAPYTGTIDVARPADEAIAATTARMLAANGERDRAFALLAPALADRAMFRAAWLELANHPVTAIVRLTELAAATPAQGADDERVRLAGACLNLASAGVDGAATLGLQVIDPAAATPRVRLLRGELLRATGDLVSAERMLRDALRLTPDDAGVKNSLAYVLIAGTQPISNVRAEEACRLAREAMTQRPQAADVRDTLARAEWAAGRTDQAARSFREALRIDPNSLDALVGLASLHAATGQRADANAMMPEIDRRLAGVSTPSHLRRDLRTLRESLTSLRD